MRKNVIISFLLIVTLLPFLSSCKGKVPFIRGENHSYDIKYSSIDIGKTATDIKASIVLITNRTDMVSPDYKGKSWKDYITAFNRIYPSIEVSVEALGDYSDSAIKLLDSGNWGDIMMIPTKDRSQLSKYFTPLGSVDEISQRLRFAENYSYEGWVYGISSAGNVQGILYNKRVFKEAGITALPKTPDEFIEDLRLIKKNTKAIPLYTNYSSSWALDQWDYYITASATGDSKYLNHTLPHQKDPFANPGDGSGAYNVYRILYQAAAEGLIERDFTRTDWDGSKGMLNRGDIATMALGSWAFAQMEISGPHPEDVGYMPFPIMVNGEQVCSARTDNNFGINVKSKGVNKLASLIFIKWMAENSGFQYNEGEIPVLLSEEKLSHVYEAFKNIKILTDTPPAEGEENILRQLNVDSGLYIDQHGGEKLKHLIEHAVAGDMSYDEIIADWNRRWREAQEKNGIRIH